jgi:hypothetical protein
MKRGLEGIHMPEDKKNGAKSPRIPMKRGLKDL